jgi:hypothetical protein
VWSVCWAVAKRRTRRVPDARATGRSAGQRRSRLDRRALREVLVDGPPSRGNRQFLNGAACVVIHRVGCCSELLTCCRRRRGATPVVPATALGQVGQDKQQRHRTCTVVQGAAQLSTWAGPRLPASTVPDHGSRRPGPRLGDRPPGQDSDHERHQGHRNGERQDYP